MEKDITPITSELDILREHKIAKIVYAKLLRNEMSVKDLAESIYKKPKNRNEITKWIKIFLEKGWIEQVKSLKLLVEKKYIANLKPLTHDFNNHEIEYVQVLAERFWKPIRADPENSFYDALLEAQLIKKISRFKKKMIGYNPSKDISRYKKNKKQFWNDKKFRTDFLDKIKSRNPDIRYDYIFFSLLIPDSVIEKIKRRQTMIGVPFTVIRGILDN